jgi:hypothetical protein
MNLSSHPSSTSSTLTPTKSNICAHTFSNVTRSNLYQVSSPLLITSSNLRSGNLASNVHLNPSSSSLSSASLPLLHQHPLPNSQFLYSRLAGFVFAATQATAIALLAIRYPPSLLLRSLLEATLSPASVFVPALATVGAHPSRRFTQLCF